MQEFWQLSILAEASSIARDYPPLGTSILYLLGIAFFLLLNAFFVASEFAAVKARPSQLETVAERRPRRARLAQTVVEHIDDYLSATQLGITIASLMLGFLGEPFIRTLVAPTLLKLGVPEVVPLWGESSFELINTVSLVLAISGFTFLHVVVGELVPKSVAIRKSLASILLLAAPLHIFYRIFYRLIHFLNIAANLILKHLLHIDPIEMGNHIYSAEELALLVSQSGQAQEVTEMEQEIAINALELNELWVRDVMLPRQEVIMLDLESPFEEAIQIAKKTKHTRFPLVKGGHLDNYEGLIHIKDVLSVVGDEDPDLMKIRRELKVVPDTMPLDLLLKFFLKEHEHLALVVDEFGTPVGVVFLDNVIEEIVGDIQDEFDDEHPEFVRISDDEFVVNGTLTLNELSHIEKSIEVDSGEVTTIGGYLTQQLGRFPKVGEVLNIEGWQAKVTGTTKQRVGQIHFSRLPSEDQEEQETPTGDDKSIPEHEIAAKQ